ncbi:glycosyltransferase family 4 protein [Cohnella boryungensis]|uniref:Glycosyltransferase family 4 protein n=1 Tax=Cohnella boryungensis TaxID=768479 RepID=A0ABV8S4B8_9BACL
MRITFLIQSLQFAGSEKVAFELIKHYRKKQIDCSLVTLFRSSDEHGRMRMLEELRALGVRIVELNKRSGFGDAWRTLRLLNREIARFRPDIVHAHGCTPNVYAGLRNLCYRRTYTITTLHSGGDDWPSRKDQLLERLSLYGVDRVVSVAEHVASTYKSKFARAKDKLVVIENGIDTSGYAKLGEDEKKALRKALNLKPELPVLIHVARFDPIKNQHFLVEVADRLKRRRFRFRMLLVGNWQDSLYTELIRSRLREARLEEEVTLLGSRDDVGRLLQIADVFLFPSLYEASPLALLEAMHAKLTTICSDIPAARKLAPYSQNHHVLEFSSDRWADRIQEVLEKAAAENAGGGVMERLQERVSFDRVANDYLALCRKH